MRRKDDYNSYMREYMNNRYRDRRKRVVEILGGKCVDCGGVDDLEIDHIDPNTKVNSIAKLSSSSEKIFNREVLKCQLLCSTCHLKKTKIEGSLGNKDRLTVCNCGKIFNTIKQYAGHKTWCKVL